ncbi:C-type lectin domain family 4 member f [Plakobranchus ocellatus]|uniref:C-type lectin domain family 4 member f n=1 Tax=Plakobranchus ocellatus TaxID=259542 RepID=A0AAV4A6D1_9GAST|nr:C-type lectin domain family 4 member f [Plakobranchus ocellatus]
MYIFEINSYQTSVLVFEISVTDTRVHIGATDLVTEGVFVWEHSGKLLSETYSVWNPGQPDNANNEDYLVFSRWKRKLWNDVQLIHWGMYICEKVHPEYFHSYVVVLPSEDWSHDIHSMSALLTASSKDYHLGHNYVEVTSFPDGQLEELSVTDKETAQYRVNIANLTLGKYGTQRKYLLIKSSEPLDVHFFLWNSDLTVLCSSLVLDVMESGVASSFLGHSGLEESSYAFVSTEETSAQVNVYLPSNNGHLDFYFNNLYTESRTTMTMSTTLREQYQTFYAGNISGLSSATLAQSTGSMPGEKYIFGCKYDAGGGTNRRRARRRGLRERRGEARKKERGGIGGWQERKETEGGREGHKRKETRGGGEGQERKETRGGGEGQE